MQRYPTSVERLQARLQWAESLLQLKELLTSTLDVAEVYRRAARAFVENFEIRYCVISSWEQAANTLTTQAKFTDEALREGVFEFTQAVEVYDLATFPDSARLLQTNEPVIRFVDDPGLAAAEKEILLDLQMSHSLEVPLVYQNRTVGIVELYRSDDQHIFNNEEIDFAKAMAVQIAGALHNAQITTEANRRAAELSMLNRLGTAFSSAPTLADVFLSANREITSLFEITKLALFLRGEDQETLQLHYCLDNEMEVAPDEFSMEAKKMVLLEQVVDQRDLLLVQDEGGWLGLPLIVANRVIGVLILENEYDENAFNPQDLELLRTIVGPLATTVSRLIQFEALQEALARQSEQRLQLQTAAAVASATTDILELEELIQRAVDLIKERFQLYYVGLFLIDAETNFAVLRAGTDEPGRLQVASHHQLHVGGRSLIGGATFDGQSRITQDVLQDSEWRPNPHLPQTRSELALPLRVRGRIIGALTVQSVRPNHFSEELIETLLAMSDQMSVAIENAQLIAQVQGRAERQRKLNQISALLHSTSDVNSIIEIGLKALSEHIGHADVELALGSRQ
ncbi:MAG: GAF domain-containing protein [Chloroflexota bacterium]